MSSAAPDASELAADAPSTACYCEDPEHAQFIQALIRLSVRDRRALGGLMNRLAGLDADEALRVIGDVEAIIREGQGEWDGEARPPTHGRRPLPT